MTEATQKATQIYMKYVIQIPFDMGSQDDKKSLAKRCASLAVTEILMSNFYMPDERRKYWEEVKKEIESI